MFIIISVWVFYQLDISNSGVREKSVNHIGKKWKKIKTSPLNVVMNGNSRVFDVFESVFCGSSSTAVTDNAR